MVGTKAWIGGFLNRTKLGSSKFLDYALTSVQEQHLKRLQERISVPFDESRFDHEEALRSLWKSAFPKVRLKALISDQWKDMGWQGANPSTDFRGCGFISLENLLFFAKIYPGTFRRLLLKKGGRRSKWEYPFAVAGINISFMLIQMLDLQSGYKPKCIPGANFVKVLGGDEEAFDMLFCVAFAMMDAQWLAMKASYMDFNEILNATRGQLERELTLEDVNRVQDLPSYNLLY
ncbi:hypothetical protein M569_02968 [Genlisea aurea]|uniref:ELMO domain-containing protein n=1 Tax=Genlisea aurea TaxID=192259 RepID=S8EGI1_9LAMI|nr:hypothetical protein M569_02968 [Genlisea aurea]